MIVPSAWRAEPRRVARSAGIIEPSVSRPQRAAPVEVSWQSKTWLPSASLSSKGMLELYVLAPSMKIPSKPLPETLLPTIKEPGP